MSRPLSLDDAAAILLQLDASDAQGLRAAQRQFAQATGDTPQASSALSAIARCLVMAASGLPDEAATALEAATQLLELAMTAGDDSGRDVASPTPKPAQKDEAAHVVNDALPADADVDLLREFVVECRDLFEGAEAALLALEADPSDAESINTVFRAFHTIKGTSAFFGLDRITHFAHHAETLLSAVRDRTIVYSGACADIALRSLDLLKAMLTQVGDVAPGAMLPIPAGYDALFAQLVAFDGSAQPAAVTVQAARQETTAEHVETRVATTADASVRVRTDRLDRLIDMVGELVIAQAMISQDETVTGVARHDLGRKVGHAGKIVRELQDLSMSMRMVPLKGTFQKMARLTRDVAHKTNKHVEFVVQGEDTEIDRNMVDIIGDPLVHMVRNAVDHGIELPAAREAQGKSGTGTVRLSAYHAGGNVVVELRDDGKGLDKEKILRKAVAKGLIDSEKGLSDKEIFQLIFAPGFSTNDEVTDLSGRGVGMDVVRRNIESLRGRVEITSEPGAGSTFTIRLPLTLAITDGMCVRVGGERYLIPTVHIHFSFRPEASALSTAAGRGEMVLLRNDVMPLVRLHRLFSTAKATTDPTRGLLVVVGDGERRWAILVDELLGQQQVVAKPLGDGIGRVRGVSGGAILGDGRVGLILDVAEVVSLARQGSASEAA